MPMEFEIKLSVQDLYRFQMYHNYTGFNGWFSIVVAAIALVVSFTTVGDVELGYTLLYAIFGILFLLYIPVTVYLSAKRKVTKSKEFMLPLRYRVNKEGVTVSQEEASSTLPWGQIYKVITTKSNVLIYSSRINAFVIPRNQLGDQYDHLKELCENHLESYRVRMK